MRMVPVGELLPAKKKSLDPRKFPNETFELLSIPAFDAGAPAVLSGAEIGSSKQLVEPGDVMISKIVPHIRRAWVVPAPQDGRQIASSEWIVFRSERIHPTYLRHLLVGDLFHQAFMQTVAGVGGSLLRARPRQVAEIPIPLPPIEEQRRIAAVLDAADEFRTKRRQALATLDTLTQAVFIDMFGDPRTNDTGYEERELGEVALKFSDGPFGSNLKSEHYVDSGIRVIRLQNIGAGSFLDQDRAFVSEAHFERIRKHECRPGDVLVGTLGDPNLRACIQPANIPRAVNKADCVQIRVDPTRVTSRWLVALLNCPETAELAQSLVKGQTRARIAMGRLRKLRVPVPPLELQQAFERQMVSIQVVNETTGSSQNEIDTLFSSLQQRAFAGEL